VVDAMLYVAQAGCWAQALTVLHGAARQEGGRVEETPSMIVIGPHLARSASNGGFAFHDRGGPYGRTQGRQARRGRAGRARLDPRGPGQ
jgi:hypothetical protein